MWQRERLSRALKSVLWMSIHTRHIYSSFIEDQMFNANPNGHAIIIEKLQCKLSNIIKSSELALWVRNLAKALVDNKQTWDHLVDASTRTMKYLNSLQVSWIGP